MWLNIGLIDHEAGLPQSFRFFCSGKREKREEEKKKRSFFLAIGPSLR
jgi:hypothetical protein